MIPADLLAEQLQITAHINAATARKLVGFWQRIDPAKMDRKAMTDFVTAAVREITSAYGEIAAIAAAEFYDEVREIGGFVGKAAVPLAGTPPEEQLKAVVRWGIGPLWEDTPRPDAALARLQGSTSRLALQPGRLTTYEMVKRDRVRYAHVPQGKTCPFCLMLASRGAVYYSEQPHYHDRCDCISVAVFAPDDLPAINREMQEEWRTVTRGQRDQMAVWNQYVADTYGTTT
jgi:hypothetical protein